jgi:predicted TIM-barrel fold metal-dependent hydrolase
MDLKMNRTKSAFDRWKEIGPIDCDVHLNIPSLESLFPYLSIDWRNLLIDRGYPNYEPNFYPKYSPLSVKPGSSPFAEGKPGSDFDLVREQALDYWNVRYTILNCLYGVQMIPNEYLALALARAINDWQTAEWLEKDSRLKASIIVADQNPLDAVKEIERLGDHPGFLQVLLLVRSRLPYGKRYFWPIFEAAEAYGLPICIHAGGAAGNPITAVGWPSYYAEDYINQSSAFQEQVISLVSEGVFSKFPKLRIVMAEGGFTWLPSLMWRFDKNWKGLRVDTPWVDRLPSEIIREHFRFTIQPMDEPNNPRHLLEVIEMIGSEDMLLFSTDYPHWQFDRPEDAIPAEFPINLERKLLVQNAQNTYRKLAELF